MKRELVPARRKALAKWPLYLYRILVLLILLLAVILISGTIYGFVRSRGGAPLFKIGGASLAGEGGGTASQNSPAADNVFTGIGRLRIPLAAQGSGTGASSAGNAGTLILSIAFPYPNDQAFTEELAAKIGSFRTIAAEYFSALPAEKVINMDEDAAKTELLKRYNAALRLGKIRALYFSDLMIIE